MHLIPRQNYTITGYTSNISLAFRQKLFSLGMLPGSSFRVIRIAPLGDPIQIEIRRTQIALRKKDFTQIIFDDEC
ncbi:ferrous iron transporter A [Sodalis sp. dw_96]|uniref:ferrous iron transporter A n=1 Tax=Sodalis sp. dw_96 TaxID=2719794 RepID=UPI001BD6BF2F|nr:ferrous iron transporter A [Sodalis sp. dw_96]